MKTTLCLTLTLLAFVMLVFVPNSFSQDTSPEYIVKLFYVVPRDQEPLPDIDATVNEMIKNAQSAFAELMENHGFDRKTFTYETDADGNAVVHHIKGTVSQADFYNKFRAAIEEIYGKYSPIVDEMQTILDEHPNTISLIMFDYDGLPSFCGEAGRLDRVAFVKLGDGCLNHHVMAHELAHIFGLWHHNIVDDILIPNSYTGDRMLLSFCSAEWLNICRYFNTDLKNSTGPTTTQMLPALASPPNAVRLRFEVADPDGLYMAQLVVAAPGGGDVIACKRLQGDKAIVEFETTKLDLILDGGIVTIFVVDETGDIADFHSNTYPIDINPVLPRPEPISIPDLNLAAAVREKLGLALGVPITQLDMLTLTALNTADRKNITNLTGIEHAKNLNVLRLLENQISDITPLAKLQNLVEVDLRGNEISDITSITKLTQLRILHLGGNKISDISPLEELIRLEKLNLGFNQISDIIPLTGLTQLHTLLLSGNEISDIRPLEGMTNLSQLLLYSNKVSNLGPLAKLTNLQNLHLVNNNISDITPLTRLTNLHTLRLSENQISDVNPLVELTNLKELYLVGNPIKNQKPLLTLLRKNPNMKIYLKNYDEPLPVTLSHFRAAHTNAGVVLKWTTESEIDNAGFFIYRSETKAGKFKVVNRTLIQGAGTTSERNTYTWKDTTAKPNVAYYYRIEDISHAGVRKQLATVRMRGLVSAKGKLTTSWADLKAQQ